MRPEPSISVLMPVYNTETYLAEAIQSIIAQTYVDFELLVIDDGSTDNSFQIAKEFAQLDARVRPIHKAENQGLVSALNLGLDLARGEYIARMDADDISLPERLEKQITYLRVHPEVGVIGSRIRYMDAKGNLSTIPKTARLDINIRWSLFFENPFSHPVVMMRKSIIDQHHLRYSSNAEHVEDYEFWGRFLLVSKGANLPEILLHYRIHPGSVGDKCGRLQNERAMHISGEIIEKHLPDLDVSPRELQQWLSTHWDFEFIPYHERATLMLVYLKIWRAFCKRYANNVKIRKLRANVISWGALMSLYPWLQRDMLKAVWLLSKTEWRWPFLLLFRLPYLYLNRHKLDQRVWAASLD